MSRSRDGPATFLTDFHGFLQADAYGGYDGIYPGLERHDRGSGLLGACAAEVLRRAVERAARGESGSGVDWATVRRGRPGARIHARGAAGAAALESVPILDRLEKYLDELSSRSLPKSALGKAITYARNQRAALRQYVSDGRLTIDNNISERTLRLQAIGRKNWEFLGSEAAGPRAAVLFTIMAGAKRHHLEPWAYVRDLLLRLSTGERNLEALLPDRWAASHPEHVLQHRLDESRQKAARQTARRERRRATRPPQRRGPAISTVHPRSRPPGSTGQRRVRRRDWARRPGAGTAVRLRKAGHCLALGVVGGAFGEVRLLIILIAFGLADG